MFTSKHSIILSILKNKNKQDQYDYLFKDKISLMNGKINWLRAVNFKE